MVIKMDYLSFDESKVKRGFFYLYHAFEEELKKSIELSNVIQKAINENYYNNYYKLKELDKLINGYTVSVEYDGGRERNEYIKGLLCKSEEDLTCSNTCGYFKSMVKELETRFKYFKDTITNIINNSDGTDMGRLSHIFDDLEACMEHQNFYDFFFLSEEAKIEIDRLGRYYFGRTVYVEGIGLTAYGSQYFEVEEGKRRMTRKLNYYRNLVAKHHPEAIKLWEKIRHNSALAKAQENIVNLQEDLVEANQAQALATTANAAATAMAAKELKESKMLQTINIGISAYEALQMRKITKKSGE